MGQLICELHRPGMTALHRVGLAGLYMTLDAFEKDIERKTKLYESGLRWDLANHSVKLEFDEKNAREALAELFAAAFQADEQGFFRFPGLERGIKQTLGQKSLLYQTLLGTFLQHGNTRQLDKSRKGSIFVEIDEKQVMVRDFAPVTSYLHQNATDDFLRNSGQLVADVKIAGPIYPGGAQRHTASGYSATALQEPVELTFCLLFAPIGAIFFQLSSRRTGGKARTALVLPTIKNLGEYARLRRFVAQAGVLKLTAASPTDAALQLTILAKGQEVAEALTGPIRVMAFGIVSWNKKQKSRTAAYTVTPSHLPGLRNYELASRIFQNRWQKIAAKTDRSGKIKEPEHHFVRPFTAREIIAGNVAARRAWFAGFAEFMTHPETRVSLQFERKELYQMTQDAEYEQSNERIFILTCHEAWRRRLGQLGERARREGAVFTRLANGEYEKLRVSLARCKNAATLRSTVTDFWSRAGSLPSLQTDWTQVLPLLEENQWRKARDLALLALASYPPSSPEEQNALTVSTENDEPGEEE